MRRLLTGVLTLALAMPVAARAHERDELGCPFHVDETSEAKPNAEDPAGDWVGLTPGARRGLPWGDAYREGTDILKVWATRGADDTFPIRVHVQVASLGEQQPNSHFSVEWTTGADTQTPVRNWVGVILGGLETRFRYGHIEDDGTIGGQLFATDGPTTGQLLTGTPGTVVIDVPAAAAPVVGGRMTNFQAATHFLLGSPEPLPYPLRYKHGLLELIDDTKNAGTGQAPACDPYRNDPATDNT